MSDESDESGAMSDESGVCQAYCRQGGGSFTIDLFRLPLGFTVVEQLYSVVLNMRYSGFL